MFKIISSAAYLPSYSQEQAALTNRLCSPKYTQAALYIVNFQTQENGDIIQCLSYCIESGLDQSRIENILNWKLYG